MNEHPVLELDRVTHAMGGRKLLDDVSWTIRRGEQWAVLGPNGSGKTTLIRVAAGYLWPNVSGRTRWLGNQATDLGELRKHFGWISHVLPGPIPRDEPALDTVISGAFGQFGLKRLLSCTRITPAIRDAARAELHRVGASELTDRHFGTLSQGERQLILLARARMKSPLAIFLDEPCAALDPTAQERFLSQLDKIAASGDGPALVLVTHHLDEIVPSFGQLAAMRNGRIIRAGSTHEVLTPALAEQLYQLPIHDWIERDGRRWPIWGPPDQANS